MGAPDWFVDVFPIEHGDVPSSYVSLPEGRINFEILILSRFPG